MRTEAIAEREPARTKAEIRVSGMTCVMCARTVEESLRSLPGVLEVNLNLGAEKAYVTYNSRITTIVDMRRFIAEAGYQYLGVDGEDDTADEKERSC